MDNILKRWIRKSLTRTVYHETRRGRAKKIEKFEETPSERLVYGLYISIIMLVLFTTLQIVHIFVLGTWNDNIWTAITGLVGTITGMFLGAKA